MRKTFVPLVAFVALAAGIGGAAIARRDAPPQRNFVRASLVDLPPVQSVTAIIDPAPLPPQSAAATPAPQAPPSASRADELPTIEVPARPIHDIADDAPIPTPPQISLRERDGREVRFRNSPSPGGAGSAGRPITTASLNAAAAARTAPEPSGPVSGAAQAAGIGLRVAGRTIRLFGVRPPEAHDRCAVREGTTEPCAAAAQAALAARLKGQGTVTCIPPLGQRGDPAFVCRDTTGTDLGSFLVAGGYALADPAQSYEYVGPEGSARDFSLGLWHYR